MIDGSLFDWELLAEKPGMAQIRRFIVETLRLAVYNEFRQGMNGEPLTSKGHLLIATRNRDLAYSEIFELHKLVAKGFSLRTIDCSMLFDAARNNPYEVLFEELSGTGRQVFCLTNLGALLSTGGKIIVKKVIDKIRSDEQQYVLWLCGYKQDIDALLNMYPSLRAFFPADRRLEQEAYRDFELVQAFFAELKEQKLYCSIDAMDALARALLEGCATGILSTWTIDDIRRFVIGTGQTTLP